LVPSPKPVSDQRQCPILTRDDSVIDPYENGNGADV
jgi:hypothetical protein